MAVLLRHPNAQYVVRRRRSLRKKVRANNTTYVLTVQSFNKSYYERLFYYKIKNIFRVVSQVSRVPTTLPYTAAEKTQAFITVPPNHTKMPVTILQITGYIGVLVALFYSSKSWYVKAPIKPSEFGAFEYDVVRLPTTLATAATRQKTTDLESKLMLYRGSQQRDYNPNIIETLGDYSLRTFVKDDQCVRKSLICPPCHFDNDISKSAPKTLRSIFSNNSSSPSMDGEGQIHADISGSFAEVSNELLETLYEITQIGFDPERVLLDHSFISNFRKPLITTSLHANGETTTASFQMVGKTTYVLFDRADYKDNFKAMMGSGRVLPTRTPKKSFNSNAERARLYLVTLAPGDLLFIPAYFAHTTITHAGPNMLLHFHRQDYWTVAMFNFVQTLIGRLNNLIERVLDSPLSGNEHWGVHSHSAAWYAQRVHAHANKKIANACLGTDSETSGLKSDDNLLEMLRNSEPGLENL